MSLLARGHGFGQESATSVAHVTYVRALKQVTACEREGGGQRVRFFRRKLTQNYKKEKRRYNTKAGRPVLVLKLGIYLFKFSI